MLKVETTLSGSVFQIL